MALRLEDEDEQEVAVHDMGGGQVEGGSGREDTPCGGESVCLTHQIVGRSSRHQHVIDVQSSGS